MLRTHHDMNSSSEDSMSDEPDDPNHIDGLFGGHLTVERINATLRAFKAQGVETVDLYFTVSPADHDDLRPMRLPTGTIIG